MGWSGAAATAFAASAVLARGALASGYGWGHGPGHNPGHYPFPAATHTYDWTVSRATIAPDGVKKAALLVNNEFPGPTLKAKLGDYFKVTVHNNLTDPGDGTLIHWHGLNQQGTPWYDGTPASQLCPIAPGDSFTYTFKADSVGTSWWHSHYSAQHTDGLKGPMIIDGPASAWYDEDLGPIFLTDHYHNPYEVSLQTVNAVPNAPVFPDSTLINGKGQFNCTLGKDCPSNTPYSTFNFKTGKKYRLRIINSSADNYQCFSIDGHSFTVIATDFTAVKPFKLDVLTLNAGQRMDVIVKATGKPKDAVWMRADASGAGNLLPFPPMPKSRAVVYYQRADKCKMPTSTAVPDKTCGIDPLPHLKPAIPSAPPRVPATTKEVDITVGANATGHIVWYQNNATFRGNYNYPVLLLTRQGNQSYPDLWNVYNFGSNSSIRMIFYNKTPLIHPMHLHGHQFWVLATGNGTWDGSVLNGNNPPRRDTQTIPAGTADVPGYMVIEWMADNPGIWPLHCHVAWHSGPGFYLNVMERPDDIPKIPMSKAVKQSLKKQCRNWWRFTNTTVVNQIDSGE